MPVTARQSPRIGAFASAGRGLYRTALVVSLRARTNVHAWNSPPAGELLPPSPGLRASLGDHRIGRLATMGWPVLPSYEDWRDTCDTLHAHTQVLGKLAGAFAAHEPQLQHTALRLTARGWETAALPAPDDSGALVVALDLHRHQAVIEHSRGDVTHVALTPDRPVGDVTTEVLDAVRRAGGDFELDLRPAEVPWTIALDEDDQHARYDRSQVEAYFAAATRAALVLAEFRAPYRGRSTQVNAWWGSFDLAVNLFSGRSADPPAQDFITRNAMDAQEFAVGWWPGDARYGRAAFYAYAHPAPDNFGGAELAPPSARWDHNLGEYILDWDDVCGAPEPGAAALDFARSAFRHTCVVCDWDETLLDSAEGTPPPMH